jgi:general secretion pathway protein G
MTLIEIIVVVAIISMITVATAVAVMQVRSGAQADVARLDLKTIQNALDIYAVRTGKYPDSLQALVEARILKGLPRDPWRNKYAYVVGKDLAPVITSYGRDGVPGGTGEDADISSAER